MSNWFADFYRDIRPNARWDMIKWIVLGVIALFSWYTSKHAVFAGIPPIVIGIGAFAVLAVSFAAIGFGISKVRVNSRKPELPMLDQTHAECKSRITNLEIDIVNRDAELNALRVQWADLTARLTGKTEQLKGVVRERDALQREKEEREKEQRQPKRADIRGEIREGSFVSHTGNMHARVRVRTIFYNRGELTTLRGFRLKVSHPYHNQTWESQGIRSGVIGDGMPNLADLVHQKPPFEIVPGKHIDGWLQFETRNVAQSDELFDPALIITDGFGDEHVIESKLRLRRTR